MIPTATSRIDGIAILQHHDGQPVVRTYRTTAKGKTRYEFDYPLEDTHLASEAQTVCQAPSARRRQLSDCPRSQVRESRRTSTRRRSKRLAATIESVEAPETVR